MQLIVVCLQSFLQQHECDTQEMPPEVEQPLTGNSLGTDMAATEDTPARPSMARPWPEASNSTTASKCSSC